MDHRINDDEGDEHREIFGAGPNEGQDDEGCHRNGFHKVNRWSEKIVNDWFPVGHGAGDKSDQKGDEKSQTDAREGKPDGSPEVRGNDQTGKCLKCVHWADKQDSVVDDGGTNLPEKQPESDDSGFF